MGSISLTRFQELQGPQVLGVQRSSHWTTREILIFLSWNLRIANIGPLVNRKIGLQWSWNEMVRTVPEAWTLWGELLTLDWELGNRRPRIQQITWVVYTGHSFQYTSPCMFKGSHWVYIFILHSLTLKHQLFNQVLQVASIYICQGGTSLFSVGPLNGMSLSSILDVTDSMSSL